THAADAIELHRAPAEDDEPDEREGGRREEHPDDEFADRAPAGDPGEEHSHEWGPGDGPRPVEHRPVDLPAPALGGELAHRVVPERERNDVLRIDPHGLDELPQEEDRVPEE